SRTSISPSTSKQPTGPSTWRSRFARGPRRSFARGSHSPTRTASLLTSCCTATGSCSRTRSPTPTSRPPASTCTSTRERTKEWVHDFTTWMNQNDIIGFNAATLAHAETRGKKRAMGFTGPGIACDYLDIEGPIHDVWPPKSHRALFGDLPIKEFELAGSTKV